MPTTLRKHTRTPTLVFELAYEHSSTSHQLSTVSYESL